MTHPGPANLVARCLALTQGDAVAALLLQRALYWMPRAKVQHGGHRWIAKSRHDWAAETGASFDRCKRALARLRHLGLAATEQHHFGNRNITHLRLIGRALTLLPRLPDQGKAAPPEGGQAAPPEWGKPAPLHIQGDTNKELQQGEDGVLTHAIPADSDSKVDSGEDSDSDSKGDSGGENKMKAKDVLETIHKPQKHLSLENLWKTIVAEVEEVYVPPLTAKQKGQLKHFAKRCPEGKAALVLEFVLRHWSWFIDAAKTEAGVYKPPTAPDVGFLLKHVAVAVNLWLKEAGKPKFVPPKPVPPPVQSIAPPPPEPEDHEEEFGSAAEAVDFFYGEET